MDESESDVVDVTDGENYDANAAEHCCYCPCAILSYLFYARSR